MFNSSLSEGLLERILPTTLKQFFSSGQDNHTAFNTIPPELLDRIIDNLHDDRLALLALGLTSKHTLARSRVHLFAKLEFTYTESPFDDLVSKQKLAKSRYLYTKLQIDDGDRQFDEFLDILEAPWTSFTFAVESLHIKDLFHPSRRHNYRPNKNIPRITANLPNLKTLCLTSISWPYIPLHVRDFFFQLDIADLRLVSVEFTSHQQNDFEDLFRRLQPSVKSVTLYNLQFDNDGIANLSPKSSIFQRRIHLKSLDTSSLLILKDVWDPLGNKHLEVTVDSFHLRLAQMTRRNIEAYTPFISRFLHHIGPSLQRLLIKLSDPYPDASALPYHDSLDLSGCVNLRTVHIETITLGHASHSGEEMSPMMSTALNLLSNLPSNLPSLEEIIFAFRPNGDTPEAKVAELKNFAWLDLIGRLQKMFWSLKRIAVCVGYYAVDGEDFAPYLRALHQVPGMRQLEEKGIVSLEMIPFTVLLGTAWREAMGGL